MTTTTDDIAAVMALSGEALRVAVANEVMGRVPYRQFNIEDRWDYEAKLPSYDTDHNAAAEVLAEVEKRGLLGHVAMELFIGFGMKADTAPSSQSLANALGRLMTASPTDKCRAALLAVRQAGAQAKERTGEENGL